MPIQRDRDVMQYGDRIPTFMDRIARGAVDGRVFIVLSDKYLRSLYCMYELHEVWRYCMQDAAKFIQRTRVFVHPSASIATEVERSQYVIHWRKQYDAIEALVREHGTGAISTGGHAEQRRTSRFVNDTPEILRLVQDMLRPSTFEEFVRYGFGARPEGR